MVRRILFGYSFNSNFVLGAACRKDDQADENNHKPNANGFPAHQALPIDLDIQLKVRVRGRRSPICDLRLRLGRHVIILVTGLRPAEAIHDIDDLEQVFLSLLEEFALFFLFDLQLSHVSLSLVLFDKMLVDLLHLLGGTVELECDDPC